MCLRCDDGFECATRILDDIIGMRKFYGGGNATVAQNVTEVTHILISSLEPDVVQGNPYVQNICLGLAAAVERLVALEQCGLTLSVS
jgi:hypothetical protein